MARDFLSAGSDEYLNTTSSPISDISTGLTMAAWVKVDSEPTANQHFMSIGNSASGSLFATLEIAWASGDFAGAFLHNTPQASVLALGTTDLTALLGEWMHICGTYRVSGGNRVVEVFLNGTSEDSDTQTTGGAFAWDRVSVGATADLSIGGFFDGSIADAAAWNVVLSDADIAVLANPVSPLTVKPASLKFYAPLTNAAAGNEADIIGGRVLTESGTVTYSESPLLMRPWMMNWSRSAPAAGGGGRIMSSLANRGGLAGEGGIAGIGGGLAG